MKKIFAICLVLVMMFTFAACGSKSAAKSEGPLDGTTYTWDDLKDTLDWEYKLVFAEGKVTKQDISEGNVRSEASGTYEIDGTTIKITIQGGTETGTISEDKSEILIDDGGEGTRYHKE